MTPENEKKEKMNLVRLSYKIGEPLSYCAFCYYPMLGYSSLRFE